MKFRSAAAGLLVVLALIASMQPFGGVLASHNATVGVVGGFEVDGNFAFPTPPDLAGETRDWSNVAGPVVDPDPGNDATDDIFGSGSKEQEPDNWTYSVGKPPGKDDLTRVYAANEVTDSSAYLWLGFERLAVSGQGDAHANFELNQKTTTIVNSKGTTIPERKDGDLLVVYDYSGGTGPVTLEVRKWDGVPDVAATPQNEEALFGSWVVATIPAGAAFADINGSSVSRPSAAPFGGGSVAAKRFGEVGLDLRAIFGSNFVTCPGFGRLLVKTRSSGESFNSALKDKNGPIAVNVSSCAKKNWSFSFNPQPIAGAGVFAVYTVEGGAVRTLQLTDTDGDGTFTVTDPEIPPGTVAYHFEVRNAAGDLIWRSADGSETFALGQTKTNTSSLAYGLTLTPETAENFAGSPHRFTARVFEVGTDTPLPNVTVAFATFGGTPDGCGSLSPASAVTDARGEAATTLSSDDPCTTSIRAFVNGTTTGSTTGFNAGEVNDTSTKAFVQYAIAVSPDTAVNEANQPHTFTVTLTKDSGGGAVALSGATIALSLSTGGSDAHFTEINGAAVAGTTTTGSCTTDGNGQCTATIVSTEAGETTLTATYTATDSSGATRDVSNTGVKHYVDASIEISPGDVVNEVGVPHTFTVTVTAAPDGTGTPTFGPIATSVSPTPDSQSNTCGAGTRVVSGNTATCTITINNSTAGVFTVDASATVTMGGVVVTRSTSGYSGPAGTGSATKRYVDAAIAITPLQAVNEVGAEHVFTITATAYPSGAGTPTYVIGTSVTPDPTSQSSTCGTPVVSADGNTATCTLTINSSTATTYTVDATADVTMGSVTVQRATSGNSGPGGTGSATKRYVLVTLEKAACPASSAAPGALLTYTLSFRVAGATLTHATLVDDLPTGVVFLAAGTINGVTPTRPAVGAHGGKVTWSFPTLAPGDYTGTISAQVANDATLGGSITNTVTLDADEIAPKQASSTILVTDAGKAAAGRAYGVSANLLSGGLVLGDPDIKPTPDTDVAGPRELASVPDPFGSTTPLASLLQVSKSDQSAAGSAAYSAIATAAAVRVNAPGAIVSADSVVAKSTSQANGTGAGSASGGSLVQNLVVNGTQYGDVSEPTTIVVRNPLTDAVLAEVKVLEKIPSGAAAGAAQPNSDNEFASGLVVNAIHVIVHDLAATVAINEASDIVVSHAETTAEYPSGLACETATPTVSGLAYALDAFNVDPNAANARVAEVVLPILGGSESATLADVVLPAGLGTSGSAFTSTKGEITDGPDPGAIPVEAHSLAQIEGLDLAGGTVKATLVKATSDSTLAGSSGATTIADLVIAGIDVCKALGLTATCEPPVNKVFVGLPEAVVLLNEQIPTTGGLTVNAVHIYVLGNGNPLGLPAGAEIIISSAHSDAHPAPA